jgi:hypothetical protein
MDRFAPAVKALAACFAFLPFSYALQVSTRNPYAPLLGYLLLVGAMLWLLKEGRYNGRMGRPDALSTGFLFLIIHHVVMCWIVADPGEEGLVARVLVLFTVPLILFWVPRTIDLDGLELIISFITIAALLVSIELIYENVSTQVFETSSFFQLLNKSYLHEVLGSEGLSQMWWHAYRAAGLIEHPHATALYCNMGMCMAALLYIFQRRKFYLAISLICALAVWTQGFRVPVISQAGLIVLFGVFACLEVNTVVRRRAATYISLYALMVLCIFVVDPTYVVHRYYLPSTQGDFQLPNQMGVGTWIKYTLYDLVQQSYFVKWLEGDSSGWRQALFGHGLLGTLSGRFPFSDDMFLLALPLQYGILGFVLFISIWITAIGAGIKVHIRYLDLQVPMQLKMVALISLCAILLLALSMGHSGVLQRKAIYPLFPFFIGVLARMEREYLDLRVRACKSRMADMAVRTTLK